MARALIMVMDSFGVGAAPDADKFGDQGADTLGHIVDQCAPKLPNLARLGLGLSAKAATGRVPSGLEYEAPIGAAGAAAEVSFGKDTPSGHWEIAGCPVAFDWGYFPDTVPSFPDELIAELCKRADLPGVIGNKHASGTEIIQELGDEHVATGKPIVYTSADSVFQIAAHEESFGLERLYELCAIAKELTEPMNIGRVIARPFVGTSAETYERTANRKDLTTPPFDDTLLDIAVANGHEVISVGKIADIFAHRGLTKKVKAAGNNALFDTTLEELRAAPDGALVFSNFVDFDMMFGHRRNVQGYADALEAFDARLPEIEAELQPGDLVLITADHGCDPTWPGSDHTREFVPVVFFGPGVNPRYLGRRASFADMGQTIARHLGLPALAHGEACL